MSTRLDHRNRQLEAKAELGVRANATRGTVEIGVKLNRAQIYNIPMDPLSALALAQAIVRCAQEAGASAPDWYQPK